MQPGQVGYGLPARRKTELPKSVGRRSSRCQVAEDRIAAAAGEMAANILGVRRVIHDAGNGTAQ